jgi:hypothetical protein
VSLAKATDIAIGLVLTILVVSAFCSGATEAIARILKKRAKGLWDAIVELIEPGQKGATDDPRPLVDPAQRPAGGGNTLTDALYDSPFVVDLAKKANDGRTLVAHLSTNEFSQGLIHAALAAPAGAAALASNQNDVVNAVVAGLSPDSWAGKAVKQLATEVGNDAEKLLAGIETWFDAQMSRLARVYRNWSRLIAFFIALTIAIGANVDLVFITRQLNASDVLRASVTSEATKLVDKCKDKSSADALATCVRSDTSSFTLPIGWQSGPVSSFDGWNKLWKPLGWLLTALAAMWGAPFWFDLLKRITGLKSGSGSSAGTGSGSGSG